MADASKEILKLAEVIQTLPMEYRQRFASALQVLHTKDTRRTRLLDLIGEALATLRVDMKYLMFDLEATRCERDDYKAQLEKK